jgi:hypothetical protein
VAERGPRLKKRDYGGVKQRVEVNAFHLGADPGENENDYENENEPSQRDGRGATPRRGYGGTLLVRFVPLRGQGDLEMVDRGLPIEEPGAALPSTRPPEQNVFCVFRVFRGPTLDSDATVGERQRYRRTSRLGATGSTSERSRSRVRARAEAARRRERKRST